MWRYAETPVPNEGKQKQIVARLDNFENLERDGKREKEKVVYIFCMYNMISSFITFGLLLLATLSSIIVIYYLIPVNKVQFIHSVAHSPDSLKSE